MDRLSLFREKIKEILGSFAALVKRTSRAKQIDTVTLFDEESDNYMVYRIGWEDKKRIHLTMMYVRIVEGKIWFEENRTEIDIAQELMDLGISKDEMCLGFIHPLLREEEASAVA